jgi:hypothetical protein
VRAHSPIIRQTRALTLTQRLAKRAHAAMWARAHAANLDLLVRQIAKDRRLATPVRGPRQLRRFDDDETVAFLTEIRRLEELARAAAARPPDQYSIDEELLTSYVAESERRTGESRA